MPLRTPFGRATWRVDAALIWFGALSGALSGIAWFLGWFQGLGVGYAFLLALTAFPLAFLSCVLVRHYREIGQTLAAFFGHRVESVPEPAHSDIPDAVGEQLAKLWDAVNRTMEDVAPRLSDIERSVEHNTTMISGLERDMIPLLYHALYSLNLPELRDLLVSAPHLGLYYEQEAITPMWLAEQREIADDFVVRATKALRYTPRHDRLVSILQIAENEAELQVRQMSADRRPDGIDPFDLRTYVIAKQKCDRVVAFLKQEELEMNEKTESQRAIIQDRYSLRN